ncbi:hypothetical protein [Sinosporangium siamense]|uniref:hypothetical protein n=1 Tax=Sinosporangium siamense TaxID=1367973 RepID=UPI001EF347C0
MVTRGGRQIAIIRPAPTAPGRMVKAMLARHTTTVDPDFAEDVRMGRESVEDTPRATWPDA